MHQLAFFSGKTNQTEIKNRKNEFFLKKTRNKTIVIIMIIIITIFITLYFM